MTDQLTRPTTHGPRTAPTTHGPRTAPTTHRPLTAPTTHRPLTAPDGGQRPSPRELRRLERGPRAELSAPRVHTGPTADRLAHGLGADAFACGSHVFFRRGAYRPDTPAGFRLRMGPRPARRWSR